MANAENLIKEFQQALCEEIDYIKKRGGGIKLVGRNGELEGERGDYFVYLFIIDKIPDLPEDSPIEVRVDNQVTRGYILSLEGLKLRIALEDDIGNNIPEATIIANPYYLLEVLQKRFEEVTLDYSLAEKVFGVKKGRPSNNYNFESAFKLNDSQRNAIAKGLGSEVSYIWGPPGTGKTHTLAALAHTLLSHGKSILIVSHTNIAVDNAIETLAKHLKKEKDPNFLDGKVLRYGVPNIKNLFGDIPKIDLSYWIEQKSKTALRTSKKES